MKLKLHWQIIIGMVAGLIYGIIAAYAGWGSFTSAWIAPFGEIFINLLKLIAVPLVLGSLVAGVASLSDVRKLSRIGGKTITIYIITTVISVTIGLLVVNIMKPGKSVPQEMREKLQATYQSEVESKEDSAKKVRERGPLQPLVEMVPDNIFNAASGNRNMLQVVFFAIFLGIGIIKVNNDKSAALLNIFEGLNDVVIKLVDMIMLMAPIGVFGLIADTINVIARDNIQQVVELLSALGYYAIVVLLGLILQTTLVYPTILRLFTKMKLIDFIKGIAPAQLLAFSTSSSGATLPVTMERCENNLGVSEEVSSFVLPLGATINMDGTALYQAVAAVFIAQALGLGLDLGAQITIVLTAVLASIGTAAVPGAGIIMLVIILEAISVPSAGIALILGIDRILDMCRTVTNITGDATVAITVASSENQLGPVNFDD
ncbi:MAG: dicarboxylate/amino acid:cation symporter [Calditrichae bacterium]|nr:dicarboxylate/amino acid:cation symporter [Calditrichia bacterium]